MNYIYAVLVVAFCWGLLWSEVWIGWVVIGVLIAISLATQFKFGDEIDLLVESRRIIWSVIFDRREWLCSIFSDNFLYRQELIQWFELFA